MPVARRLLLVMAEAIITPKTKHMSEIAGTGELFDIREVNRFVIVDMLDYLERRDSTPKFGPKVQVFR